MNASLVVKCIFCLILASLLTAEAQEAMHAMVFSARSARGQNALVGNVRSSVLPAVALSQAPVPRNPDMKLLVLLGSALLVLARLLRKITEQRSHSSNQAPKVRAAAAGRAA
jgi:hypothetical protein